MRVISGLVIFLSCLTGCSEMRVIGDSAMRELRADAVRVNWNTAEPQQLANTAGDKELQQLATARVRTFSSFRSKTTGKTKQVKGLWEQHGS